MLLSRSWTIGVNFANREQLKNVPRLGARTFEQAAGFLRIANSTQPLDASAVHPEAYPLVEKILAARGLSLTDIMGKDGALADVEASQFVDEQFGLPTVQDVLQELEKPARDPRPEFKTVQFRDDIQQISDLSEGLILEGVVTNVTNFGAFIDIGVHQDGLVHVSELSNGFVDDPQNVVKPNQIVKVRVIGVDAERKRISLSLRLQPADKPERGARPPRKPEASSEPRAARPPRRTERPQGERPQGDRPARAEGSRPPRSERVEPSRQARLRDEQAREQKPREEKLGSLGALLQQAGLKKSGG